MRGADTWSSLGEDSAQARPGTRSGQSDRSKTSATFEHESHVIIAIIPVHYMITSLKAFVDHILFEITIGR